MRHTPGVRAHLLQLPYPPAFERVRHRNPEPREILMVAGALNLHGFAVQEEALLGIEPNGPNAERSVHRIHHATVMFDAGDELIQPWRLQRP